MKKLAVLLSVALVVALSVPAFADMSTEFEGEFGAQLRYDQVDGFTAEGNFEVGLEFEHEFEDGNAKLVMDFDSPSADDDGAFGKEGSPFIGSNELEIAIEYIYLELTGAWFNGLPEMTTRVGSLDTNYNDWVADFNHEVVMEIGGEEKSFDVLERTDAVELSGLVLGPATVNLYHGWLAGDADGVDEGDTSDDDPTDTLGHKVAAVSAEGSFDVVDLSGAFVRETDENGDEYSTDFAVEAGVSPAEGVDVSAVFASNGRNDATAYEVSGELSTVDNLTLGVKTWSTDAAFAPRFAHYEDDTTEEDTEAFTADSKGFEVSAETTQAGVDLGLTYTNETDADGDNKVTTTEVTGSTELSGVALEVGVTSKSDEDNPKIEVTANKAFGEIDLTYELTREHDNSLEQSIAAATEVETSIADGLSLSGKVTLPDGADTKLEADAIMDLPNGFELGLHWANYDRGDDDDDWPHAYDLGTDGEADGFSVTAVYSVEF